ncbi:triose-phosphate isomerase [Microbacterium sp. GCS4]|uniref:triose-phosphate isomerase n=1 Tax=Microbacterium sp. GCS4 TaxID=1692239 RepID=UPI00067FEDE4|nr:triose-phosphate isomerase [Microbacterium sp. GCS4]KNY07665.1 hypothetical protein AKH00_05325 [Microbacterium sp. GCS4]
MNAVLTAPFFEIGPKNLLRRRELERLAVAAGGAGREHGIAVVLTVPTAMVAPIAALDSGVLVFAQGMDAEPLGPSMNRVTAEALEDAGAVGVMLNHDADPLDDAALTVALQRAGEVGLATIVCAATDTDARRFAGLRPSAVLFEPPSLIGAQGTGDRDWIAPSTRAIHEAAPGVLAMHAGGVSTPEIALRIMAAGADATGSTSGILSSADPAAAAAEFISAARAGWDATRTP